MNLYAVTFDHEADYVEAPDFAAAISVWHRHMKEENGADWEGSEQPDGVALIHEGGVWR